MHYLVSSIMVVTTLAFGLLCFAESNFSDSNKYATLKIRASWDKDSMNRVMTGLQRSAAAQASKDKASCGNDCINFCQCLTDGVVNQIPQPKYDEFFEHPLPIGDMNGREKEEFKYYTGLFQAISQTCTTQLEQAKARLESTDHLDFLATMLNNQDIADNKNTRWVEFFRQSTSLQLIDMNHIESTLTDAKTPVKTFWLRTIDDALGGNYAMSQASLDCAGKFQVMKHYSVLTIDGNEVFGDHQPSPKTPLNLRRQAGEDYKLYQLMCPVEFAEFVATQKPTKKKKS